MSPYKIKIEKTLLNIPTKIGGPRAGYAYTIQGVYYSSENPDSHVVLLDKDGDEITFHIPGQVDPKITMLESPITVTLPIQYADEKGENTLIVYGTVERISY